MYFEMSKFLYFFSWQFDGYQLILEDHSIYSPHRIVLALFKRCGGVL